MNATYPVAQQNFLNPTAVKAAPPPPTTSEANSAMPLKLQISTRIRAVWQSTCSLLSSFKLSTKVKTQYVYHLRRENFTGNTIVPLNQMPQMNGFADIHKKAISKYIGRERLTQVVIPTLKCLWNDVVFLSPLHPHVHYQKYKEIGFATPDIYYYKIPVDVFKDKKITVFKFLVSFPFNDPNCYGEKNFEDFNPKAYREMEKLPPETVKHYLESFDKDNPENFPYYHWKHIPHVLCQGIIDVSDKRISLINWKDPI